MSPKRTGMHFLFCFVDLALIAPNIRWIRRFSAAAQHLIMVHFNLSPLVESLQHDLPTERADYYKQIKDMEREGDRLTHLIFDELSTTFITPFDREDIHDLASCMDDVIDGINSSAKRIVIYNPRPISESGKELSRLIHEEAINIGKAMDELETFRKNPKPLREYCSRLHDIENQADDVYELFITKLFEEEKDCIELIKIKEIMHELEKTTDAAEHVGKILKNLIVKYS